MKISLSSVLVLALAAESTVASSWFGKAGQYVSLLHNDAIIVDLQQAVLISLEKHLGTSFHPQTPVSKVDKCLNKSILDQIIVLHLSPFCSLTSLIPE